MKFAAGEIEMIKKVFLFGLLLFAVTSISAQKLDYQRLKNPDVKYVSDEEIEKNPIPSLVFERGGLASKAERNEIIEKIVYPLINITKQTIVAIIVEFQKDKKDEILFSVILRDGANVGTLIKKNKDGKFDKDAYKIFPEEEDAENIN
jgi:hypothetical protein